VSIDPSALTADDLPPFTPSEPSAAPAAVGAGPLLRVSGLKTSYFTRRGELPAVDGVDAVIGRGEIVVVVDDADRENEGDLIMAAEFATAENIAFFLAHTSGVIVVPFTPEMTESVVQRKSAFAVQLIVAVPVEPVAAAVVIAAACV
jgi:hypothetical protein